MPFRRIRKCLRHRRMVISLKSTFSDGEHMFRPNRNRISSLVPLLIWAAIFLLLMSISVAHPLDHDEHQFIASGALLARRGLLPYRDYPYFHLPNLVLIRKMKV